MARIRSIKPDFWSSEDVISVSRNARLLFIGLWTFADDLGNGPAGPKGLKVKIFPGDQDVSQGKLEKWLYELESQGLVRIYSVDDKQYYHVTTWEHQRIDKPQPAKHPSFQEHSKNIPRTFPPDRIGGKDRIEELAATSVPATFIELARTFLEKQKERFPKESALKDFEARVTDGAAKLHLFHTSDNWTEDKIRDLLDWVLKDEFWSTQIRTLGSIRDRKKGAGSPMKFENAAAGMERSSDYIDQAGEREAREQSRQETLERRRESERADAEAATPEEAREALRSDTKARKMLEAEGE